MAYQARGDVKLYSGEASPNDVRLRDITAVTGVWASTLGESQAFMYGIMDIAVDGTIDVTLQTVVPAITGTETFTGTLVSSLGDATAAIVATEKFSGPWASTLGAATFAGAALETERGPWASTLGAATFAGVAKETMSGPWASTLGAAVWAEDGLETITGTWVSLLQDVYVRTTQDATANFIGTVEIFADPERRDMREREQDSSKFVNERAERLARRRAKNAGGLAGV